MNPEIQTLVDRIEMLERQSRGLRWTAVLAMLVAVAAIAATFLTRPQALPAPRPSTLEANRIILRDLDSRVAGGLEVDRNGTARLVLGRAGEGAAVIEAQRNGVAHLTLRGPDGAVLATLVGSRLPSLALGSQPQASSAAIETREDGSGALVLRDGQGRMRFRAP